MHRLCLKTGTSAPTFVSKIWSRNGKNQSCSKLPEMARQFVENYFQKKYCIAKYDITLSLRFWGKIIL